MVALANKLKTIKDSDQYRNHKDWWRIDKSNWFYGKEISKKNGFDEIFEANLSDINQVYASVTGASLDNKGNLVGGFVKSGKSASISEKTVSFSLNELEGLSLMRNGKPIIAEPFEGTKNYTARASVKNNEGFAANVWLPTDEAIQISQGITFNGLPVIITKNSAGKLLARVVEITKAGNGYTMTQMPLNLDPKKAKGEDGHYKPTLTVDDILPPNDGETIRLFTYAFNSQGEPQGNVILTPSPDGIPTLFNQLPNIVKAKIAASSYADPITFPPTSPLTPEQTSLTKTYNSDLALLQGAAASAPKTAVTNAPAQPAVKMIPLPPPPQTVQQQQQQQRQPQLIYPVPSQVKPNTPTQGANVAPTTTNTPAAAPRKVLDQPDLMNYTLQQLLPRP